MKPLIYISLLSLGSLTSLSSCIFEYPDESKCPHETLLKVKINRNWLPDYEMSLTRGEGFSWKYQIKVYPEGNETKEITEVTIYKDNPDEKDFEVELSLLPGEYDIWVWADICDTQTGESLYYNSSDFATITYKEPYEGNTNNRDAVRGMASFDVIKNPELKNEIIAAIDLERPMARYEIVSTDLEDFLTHENKRGLAKGFSAQSDMADLREMLEGYSVKVIYPYFMPAVFNNFMNKPIDSWSKVSFTGGIHAESEENALIGMDYVMVGDEDSSVQLQLAIYDPAGSIVSLSEVFTVPLLRDRTTIVTGRFLTTYVNGGVMVDPDFEGEFNIEYK